MACEFSLKIETAFTKRVSFLRNQPPNYSCMPYPTNANFKKNENWVAVFYLYSFYWDTWGVTSAPSLVFHLLKLKKNLGPSQRNVRDFGIFDSIQNLAISQKNFLKICRLWAIFAPTPIQQAHFLEVALRYFVFVTKCQVVKHRHKLTRPSKKIHWNAEG